MSEADNCGARPDAENKEEHQSWVKCRYNMDADKFISAKEARGQAAVDEAHKKVKEAEDLIEAQRRKKAEREANEKKDGVGGRRRRRRKSRRKSRKSRRKSRKTKRKRRKSRKTKRKRRKSRK
uniref:Uncharacterized protein n=1 Tax=viral metagenome TaxID=1070528 RepID=A0A6C0AKS0_9ZZZZ